MDTEFWFVSTTYTSNNGCIVDRIASFLRINNSNPFKTLELTDFVHCRRLMVTIWFGESELCFIKTPASQGLSRFSRGWRIELSIHVQLHQKRSNLIWLKFSKSDQTIFEALWINNVICVDPFIFTDLKSTKSIFSTPSTRNNAIWQTFENKN